MVQLTRKQDFKDGEIAFSDQVDQEFDQILDLINGKLSTDNIAPKSLTKDTLAFYVSEYWKDPVLTLAQLAETNPNNGDVCLVLDAFELYVYDETKLKWRKFLTPISHNNMLDLNAPNAHPITSITGLRLELDGIKQDIVFDQKIVSQIQSRVEKSEIKIAGLERSQIIETPYEPTEKYEGMKWLDTSKSPNVLRRWAMEQWFIVGTPTDGATIQDQVPSPNSVYSSLKTELMFEDVQKEIRGKAPTEHQHFTNDVYGLDEKLSETEQAIAAHAASIAQNAKLIDENQQTQIDYGGVGHEAINLSNKSITDLPEKNCFFAGNNIEGLPTSYYYIGYQTVYFIESEQKFGKTMEIQRLTATGTYEKWINSTAGGVFQGWVQLETKESLNTLSGSVYLTPVVNGFTSARVVFNKPFKNQPRITLAANTTAPHNVFISFTNLTESYVDIGMYRTTNIRTVIHWMACENKQIGVNA